MTRAQRWTTGVLTALALLLGAAALIAWRLPDEAEVARRLEAEFQQRLGVGLKVGRVHWAFRPVPVVVIEDIETAQEPPITVRRIALWPQLSALWQRQLAIDEVEIEGALLPRSSVRAFRGRAQGLDTPAGDWTVAAQPVQRLRFTDLRWVDRRGIVLAYDGRVDFDAGWRPRRAEVARRNAAAPARLTLAREADADRWRVDVELAGGTCNGTATLQSLPGTQRLRLAAQLSPRGIDIDALAAAFGRHAPVEGRVDGSTELHAEGGDLTELAPALQTHTRFTVRPAKLLRFDLARAVVTAGISRDGQTPLDELTGVLATQATDEGVVLRFSELKARSGLLSASGHATVLNRRLNGAVAVDLVDGVVGVPLKVGGTLDVPELSLTGGALTGAVIGSAVLPGVGTAIGARIGQRVEQFFDGGDAKKKPRKPAPKAPVAPPRH